jgi:hypothetical protein
MLNPPKHRYIALGIQAVIAAGALRLEEPIAALPRAQSDRQNASLGAYGFDGVMRLVGVLSDGCHRFGSEREKGRHNRCGGLYRKLAANEPL